MDLNIKSNFTTQDVARLIRSVSDDQDWSLVITYSGRVFLCAADEVWNRMPAELHPHLLGTAVGNIDLFKEVEENVERDKTLFEAHSDLVWFRFETFCTDCGYVGPGAAEDGSFVNRVHKKLTEIAWDWEVYGTHGIRDTYIDEF